MKRYLLFTISMCLVVLAWGQAPETFNFTGFAKNAKGQPIRNRTIDVKASILDNSSSGMMLYSEVHTVKTKVDGKFRIKVGRGTSEVGTFGHIDWANGGKYLEIGIKFPKRTNFKKLGVIELISVPYALYGEDEDSDPENELQELTLDPENQLLYISEKEGIDVSYLKEVEDGSVTTSKIGNGAVTLQKLGNGIDVDSTNELQFLSLDDELLILSEGGVVDLGPLLEDDAPEGQYFYYDKDGDNYGVNDYPVWVPSGVDPPAGFSPNPGDCDDSSPDFNPNHEELCNGIDDNCDGQIDEGCAVYEPAIFIESMNFESFTCSGGTNTAAEAILILFGGGSPDPGNNNDEDYDWELVFNFNLGHVDGIKIPVEMEILLDFSSRYITNDMKINFDWETESPWFGYMLGDLPRNPKIRAKIPCPEQSFYVWVTISNDNEYVRERFKVQLPIDFEQPEVVFDAEDNAYPTVAIGDQVWFTKNLSTRRFANGDPILYVHDGVSWSNIYEGAYCEHPDVPSYGDYGRLYNWYAAMDPRGLCPTGWRLPTDADWTELDNFLGGGSVSGGKLKKRGTEYWSPPNTDATDEVRFQALGAGRRSNIGPFTYFHQGAFFWSSTENPATTVDDAFIRWINYANGESLRTYDDQRGGMSVRCIKN